MTFSIVGRSPDGSATGIAVASKFLAVGAYVPAVAADAGAFAMQASVNFLLRSRGLQLMAAGVRASDVLPELFLSELANADVQAGAVDREGGAATYTGAGCAPWAGGLTSEGQAGSFAIQGNILVGPEVVAGMAQAWENTKGEPSLARRLLAALSAGDAAGGDSRGRQSAAILVAARGTGQGGGPDILIDLRCDDSVEPIPELERLLHLHERHFGSTPEEQLLPLDATLARELTDRLRQAGFESGDVVRNLWDWMYRENYEGRWHDNKVDPVVLQELRGITSI